MQLLSLFLFVHLALANPPTHLQPKALTCTSFPNKRAECHILENFEHLSTLHKDIQYLIVIGGNFPVLQDHPFSNLKVLQQLSLTQNKFETLTKTAFSELTNLTKLVIHGHLSRVEEDTFKPCPLLKEINLHGNKFTQLKFLMNAIAPLKHLELLILSENPIETIIKNDMELLQYSSLAEIDFSNCNIATIQENSFSSLQNLQTLHLSLNAMNEGNLSNALDNITKNLKYLYFTNSTFKNIPTMALQHISSFEIKKLSFSAHHFEAIEKDSFPLMPHLSRLDVTFGTLKHIDGEAFDKFPSLKEIYLNNNLLSQFPLNMPDCNHLTKMVLSHNLISFTQSVSYFSSVPNLLELNMAFNNISYNFLEFETNLLKLDILDLEHNNIVPWHKPVVKSKLSELDLSSNKITFVTEPMLDDFNKVHVIELHNNPFNCTTCQMAHFAKWLSSHKHLEMSLGIMCAIPENTKVVKMLKPPNCNA